MSALRSEFLQVLRERGFIHQCSDLEALDQKLASGVVTGYLGVDATADSLHIGNLVTLMMLRWLQKTGHRPIALLGGGTTKLGDPSFRADERKLLSDQEIDANIAGIRRVYDRVLRFGSGPTDAILVNNDDWLSKLLYIPFLREVGQHYSVNRMLDMDSVKLRLAREQPLSFLEFNYMILQGYDFVELARRYDCTLQIGGSDQWGNIISGVELGRRMDGRSLYALTCPLITRADGEKMGKSVSGAVWLNADRLSAYDYWQFWRNTADADVGNYLRTFTELPVGEIARLEKLSGTEINDAKKLLATEATALIHGRPAADDAAETARRTFELGEGAEGLPRIKLARALLEAGVPAYKLFHDAGLAASAGEARRLIRGGGARINEAAIDSETVLVTAAHANADGVIRLSAGRKRHAIVQVAD
jgi:tyrosyl-tRNA synthetase